MKTLNSYWFSCSDGKGFRRHGYPIEAYEYNKLLNNRDQPKTWKYSFESHEPWSLSTRIELEDEKN